MLRAASEPRDMPIKQEPLYDGFAEVQAPVFRAPWVAGDMFSSSGLSGVPFFDFTLSDDDELGDEIAFLTAPRRPMQEDSQFYLDALICDENPSAAEIGMASPVSTSDVTLFHYGRRPRADPAAFSAPVSPSWSRARIQDTMADQLPTCSNHSCKQPAVNGDRCARHAGARLCTAPGCTKNSQSNGLCIRHGGGRRCEIEGCPRGAQARGKCKAHGGGVRCKVPGCTRSSQGSGLCRTHGGGKRCDVPGCKKGTQRHGKCSTHGGARRCRVDGCVKVDRGGGMCGYHKNTASNHDQDSDPEPAEKSAVV